MRSAAIALLVALCALGTALPAAYAGHSSAHQGLREAKERACWDIYASLRNVDFLDRAIARGATWPDIRARARATGKLLAAQRHRLRRAGTASDLLRPASPGDWFDPRYRRRLSGSLKRTSRGLNCSQYIPGDVNLLARIGDDPRTVRGKSLRTLPLLADYGTSLLLLTAAFLAAMALAIRDSLERRRHVRYIVRLPATIIRDGRSAHVMLRDVARGGARIAFDPRHSLARGDRLVLAFADMHVEGHVVWAADGLAGIAFARRVRLPASLRRGARKLR